MLDFIKRDLGIIVPLAGALGLGLIGYITSRPDATLVALGLAVIIAAVAIHSNYGWRALAEELAADLDQKETT